MGSLKVRVLGLVLLASIPLLILLIVQAVFDVEAERTLIRAEMQSEANLVIEQARDRIDRTKLLLQVRGEELSQQDGCKAIFSEVEGLLPIATNVLRITKDGIIECSAIGDNGVEIDDLEWTEPFRAGAQDLVTNAFFGSQSKQWIFAIFVRYEDGEDGAYSLHAAALDADRLVETFSTHADNSDLMAVLIDRDANQFGDTPFSEDSRMQLAGEAFANDFFQFTDKNQRFDIASVRIGPENLRMLLARPAPSFFEVLLSRPARNIALPLLAIISAMLAIWWAIDALVLKWLKRVRRVVNIYAGGRYTLSDDETIAQAPSEISELAVGLDSMSNRIADREHGLETALDAKNAAIKEVHHRVKNNLQIVSSFLNLESRETQSEEAKEVLKKTRTRISALSIVHQTLYQHERLDQVELQPFLGKLLAHLNTALGIQDGGIKLESDITEALIDSDDAIPVALIILELITNSLKHATFGDDARIAVSLKSSGENFVLTVEDNGEAKDEAAQSQNGLGSRLLKAFTRQLDGALEVGSETGHSVRLIFPKKT